MRAQACRPPSTNTQGGWCPEGWTGSAPKATESVQRAQHQQKGRDGSACVTSLLRRGGGVGPS